MGNRATINIADADQFTVARFYTHNGADPSVMLPVLATVLANSLCTTGSAPNILTTILTAPGVEMEGGKPVDPAALDTIRLRLISGYGDKEGDASQIGDPLHDHDARYTIRPRLEWDTYGKPVGWELVVEEAVTYGIPAEPVIYTNAAQAFEAAAQACRDRARAERHSIENGGPAPWFRPDVWEADAIRLDGEAIVAGLCVSA